MNIEGLKLTDTEIEDVLLCIPCDVPSSRDMADAQLAKALWGLRALIEEQGTPIETSYPLSEWQRGYYQGLQHLSTMLNNVLEDTGISNPDVKAKL